MSNVPATAQNSDQDVRHAKRKLVEGWVIVGVLVTAPFTLQYLFPIDAANPFHALNVLLTVVLPLTGIVAGAKLIGRSRKSRGAAGGQPSA